MVNSYFAWLPLVHADGVDFDAKEMQLLPSEAVWPPNKKGISICLKRYAMLFSPFIMNTLSWSAMISIGIYLWPTFASNPSVIGDISFFGATFLASLACLRRY